MQQPPMLLQLVLVMVIVLLLLPMHLFLVHALLILDFLFTVGLVSVAANPSRRLARQQEMRMERMLAPASFDGPVLVRRMLPPVAGT